MAVSTVPKSEVSAETSTSDLTLEQMEHPRVSIVVPVYNEKGAVEETLQTLLKIAGSVPGGTEVIAVNDGSSDGSEEVLNRVAGIRVLHHETNRGYGASLKTGIRAARGEKIVITDADGTYPNHRIPELVEASSEYDMVVGARIGAGAKIPLIRRPPKWVLRKLANYLSGTKIPDLNSGLRVFKKSAALRFFGIISDGFSFTTTITLATLSNGYAVRFIPIEYHQRTGSSKIRPIHDTLNFLILIIRVCSYFNPIKVFLPPAFMMLLGGAGLGIYQLVDSNFTGIGEVPVLLILAGIQIGFMSLIADMVAKRPA